MKYRLQYLTIAALLTAFCSHAQRDSIRRYVDGDYRLTNRAHALFGGLQIKADEGWRLYVLYPDASLLLQMTFKDKDLRIKDGTFAVYYENKALSQSGNFSNNLLDGEWKTWYRNKQPKQEGQLKQGQLVGVWKTWFENGQQESEITYVAPDTVVPASPPANESFDEKSLLDYPTPAGEVSSRKTWYVNGNKESELHYEQNQQEGNCYWYHDNGQPATRELYRKGKLEALDCYNDSGRYTGSSCSIMKTAVFVHPFFEPVDYIVYELHKDKKRDHYREGYVNVRFKITAQGKLVSLIFTSSPDAALSERIRSIFATMTWSPAILHNRAIDLELTLSIPHFHG